MARTKPSAHLRQRIDQDLERRRRVADMKRTMLHAQPLSGMRTQSPAPAPAPAYPSSLKRPIMDGTVHERGVPA